YTRSSRHHIAPCHPNEAHTLIGAFSATPRTVEESSGSGGSSVGQGSHTDSVYRRQFLPVTRIGVALGVVVALLVAFFQAPGVQARASQEAIHADAVTTTMTSAQAAQASVALAHIPVGAMSISFQQSTRTAHTTLNMTGMPPSTSAVALVIAGT